MVRPVFGALLALLLVAAPAWAQPATADVINAAENAFLDGIESYESGAYSAAYATFNRVASEYGYHAKTTAALLMAGKAAYADGLFGRARTPLTALVNTYPESRYAPEAQRILSLAQGEDVQIPFNLGVILPRGNTDEYLGQAVFNGIRIAVEEHNATRPRRPIRMVFKASGGTPENAAQAVRDAQADGAEAVIGPLYSQEAVMAAAAADAVGIPMLAPLATGDEVTEGRQNTFQANPTFSARGRAMARYAVEGLGFRRLGVVSEAGSLGEDMAEAFAAEASRLGAAVVFQERIAGAAGWGDLERRIGSDVLSRAQGVYLPVTGADAPIYAADALRNLEGMRAPPRPLGNTEWEAITTSRSRASRLGALFTTDFFSAPGTIDAFGARYRELSGIGPDRLALMGYDLARFLISEIEGEEGTLVERLRNADTFQGLAHRFNFEGAQVNGALFVLAYRDGNAILVE
ncbi:MAG: penicillin-binding protein activator [Bacteroidota bacterium]